MGSSSCGRSAPASGEARRLRHNMIVRGAVGREGIAGRT